MRNISRDRKVRLMEDFKTYWNSILNCPEMIKNLEFFEQLKIIKQLTKQPFILFGCGEVCDVLIRMCMDLGVSIDFLCDSKKSGRHTSGLAIITPEMLWKEYYNAVIMISSWKFQKEIEETLLKKGFKKEQIISYPFQHTAVLPLKDFSEQHLAGYKWAYDFFQDKVSKNIVLGRMKTYLCGTVLQQTSNNEQYFDSGVIELEPEEVFVDGGCLDGETTLRFDQHMKGMSYKVFAFEPDGEQITKCKENLKGLKSSVQIISKGLWSASTIQPFISDGGQGGSLIADLPGSVIVEVTSLDDIFSPMDESQWPTFIKLDIEGAEKEALLGAEQIIRKKHPKLAICVYHRPQDIYELTQLLENFNEKYHFSLQHYTDNIYETVLYAVHKDDLPDKYNKENLDA